MNAAGTILVVDDDRSVRRFVCAALAAFGYTSLLDADGAERALEMARQEPAAIRLLLSDINLGSDPDGIQLAKLITALQPETRVLLMSGRPDQALDLIPGWKFLEKPFGPSELVVAVQQILESGGVQDRQSLRDPRLLIRLRDSIRGHAAAR